MLGIVLHATYTVAALFLRVQTAKRLVIWLQCLQAGKVYREKVV